MHQFIKDERVDLPGFIKSKVHCFFTLLSEFGTQLTIRSLPQFNLAASLFMVPKLMVNLQSLASQHLCNAVISWPGALFSQGKLTQGSHPFLRGIPFHFNKSLYLRILLMVRPLSRVGAEDREGSREPEGEVCRSAQAQG